MPKMILLPVMIVFMLQLFAGSAAAQQGEEKFLMPKVPGYVTGFIDRTSKMLMIELVPEGQTVDAWTDMITFQIFRQRADLKPEAYEKRLVTLWTDRCPGSEYLPITNSVENGYPSSFFFLYCPLNPQTNQPEATFFKTFQGRDAFYSAQKAFKSKPDKAQVAQWGEFFRKVAVCDSRLTDHACPDPE